MGRRTQRHRPTAGGAAGQQRLIVHGRHQRELHRPPVGDEGRERVYAFVSTWGNTSLPSVTVTGSVSGGLASSFSENYGGTGPTLQVFCLFSLLGGDTSVTVSTTSATGGAETICTVAEISGGIPGFPASVWGSFEFGVTTATWSNGGLTSGGGGASGYLPGDTVLGWVVFNNADAPTLTGPAAPW